MPADYVYKKKDGNTIDCYGKIHEDSNFAVVCENELYDGIAADIEGDKYNTWKKVCDYLVTNYRKDVVEVETCQEGDI